MRAATIVGMVAWSLGILIIMSFSDLAFQFDFGGETKSNGLFDILDILTANFMLPLGGLAMALFAGWMMSRSSTLEELRLGDGMIYRFWYFLVRYVSPVGVLLVFMRGLGVI